MIILTTFLLAACSDHDLENTSASNVIDKGLAAVVANDLGKAEGIFESATDNPTAQSYYEQIAMLRVGQSQLENGHVAEGNANLEAAANFEGGSEIVTKLAKDAIKNDAQAVENEEPETVQETAERVQAEAVPKQEINDSTAKEHQTATVGTKGSYLQSLQYAHKFQTEAYDYGDAQTNYEIAYEAWDKELNKIYGLLKEKLSTEEMGALREKQREWIKERDAAADVDPIEVAYVAHSEILTYLTAERTLYLIDLYFDEN